MTEQRILELAYHGALTLWSNANTKLDENPDNVFVQIIEKMRWNELTEIENIMYEKSGS